jgi:hypothetical protein
MIRSLYRYVFKGIGVVFLIGILTILILAAASISRQSADKQAPKAAASAHR